MFHTAEGLWRLWQFHQSKQITKHQDSFCIFMENYTPTGALTRPKKCKLEALGKMWECANEEITPQKLSTNFLLTKDDKEENACHVAAKMSNVNLLKKL